MILFQVNWCCTMNIRINIRIHLLLWQNLLYIHVILFGFWIFKSPNSRQNLHVCIYSIFNNSNKRKGTLYYIVKILDANKFPDVWLLDWNVRSNPHNIYIYIYISIHNQHMYCQYIHVSSNGQFCLSSI